MILLHTHTQFIVQVSPAEWDSTDSIWKYRIAIQADNRANEFAFRSLRDFFWLQKSLEMEFSGSLVLPQLTVALGVPNLESCSEVDNTLLADWLGDVLNGIRGQGELWFLQNRNNGMIIDSESMEAFLYRTELLDEEDYGHLEHTPKSQQQQQQPEKENVTMWDWVAVPEVCGFGSLLEPPTNTATGSPRSPTRNRLPPFQRHEVSSKALGDSRTFHIQNSFVESSANDWNNSLVIAPQMPLIQAQRELVWIWRTRSLQAIDRLGSQIEYETRVGMAWKQFSVSLTQLFAYEKDIESFKLGGDNTSKKRVSSVYRKLQKSTMDDSLRILAKTRQELYVGSLQSLMQTLKAYVADLSCVQPSVEAYLEAVSNTAMMVNEEEEAKQAHLQSTETVDETVTSASSSFAEQLFTAGMHQVKERISHLSDEKKLEEEDHHHLVQLAKSRLKANEKSLQYCLTTLLQTAPLRTARMAHLFLQEELTAKRQVQKNSIIVQTKMNVTSKESAEKLRSRHELEEREDKATEMEIVQRIVQVGTVKKFMHSNSSNDATEMEVLSGVELSKEEENEQLKKARLRDAAMASCRERLGKWDANVAMAIMEAVGVSDANVRVEETTRDLRLVRKYAIGLREQLEKCTKALESVEEELFTNPKTFWDEWKFILSTTCPTHFAGANLLQSHEIRLDDPFEWLQRGADTCGSSLDQYCSAQESSAQDLFSCLSKALEDNKERVEAVESFVYMECVGIQLEKHFSQRRADALKDFEKKTDITSAINIATRKRMPTLVKELQGKLELASHVTHTSVKEAKEAHLLAKALKQELNALSLRRLTRIREVSTQSVVALVNTWALMEDVQSKKHSVNIQGFMKTLHDHVLPEDLGIYVKASPLLR